MDPSVVLIGAGGAEYGCDHPAGIDDRAVVIDFRTAVDPGSRLLIPQSRVLQGFLQSLTTEVRGREPDLGEVDALCTALLTQVRDDHKAGPRWSACTLARVARLRLLAEHRYLETELDLVGEAAAIGLSRTRMVHDFGAVVGVTPHRFLLELRTTHAARLLVQTSVAVTDVCFESGFGSMTRFHAAFDRAFGMTPSSYRRRYRTRT